MHETGGEHLVSESTERVEAEFVLGNEVGLHARPAALLVKSAARFTARITVTRGDRAADARSLFSLLALGATRGAAVMVRAEGPDAREALAAIAALFENNFSE